ncbi:MAG TPA: DUF3784 domain-containing protein [Agriterribacter sp.]|nr:DUF3784 domain-containing protein [Agriterribacter sp.]HRQ18626.1 DUF3784 domain-containing protein [Agriterribacter sp.]
MAAWNIFTGIFFIVLGFLVKNFPLLIIDYRMMTKEQKKNADIEGLTRFLKRGLIATGVVIITGYILFRFLQMQHIANWIMLPVGLTGIMILVIVSPKYDHTK